MTRTKGRMSVLLLLASLSTQKTSALLFVEQYQQETIVADGSETEEVDDRTYLDVFGQAAKEYLTQRMVRLLHSLIGGGNSYNSYHLYDVDSRNGCRVSLELETWTLRALLRMSLSVAVGRLPLGTSLSSSTTR